MKTNDAAPKKKVWAFPCFATPLERLAKAEAWLEKARSIGDQRLIDSAVRDVLRCKRMATMNLIGGREE